nr:uncharacterized protein LOC129380472 isoform X3 [Dermacentor andersoni]
MPGNNHRRIFAVVLVGKLDEDEICLETITEEYLLSFLGMTTSALQEASVQGLGAMVARSTCLPRSPLTQSGHEQKLNAIIHSGRVVRAKHVDASTIKDYESCIPPAARNWRPVLESPSCMAFSRESGRILRL